MAEDPKRTASPGVRRGRPKGGPSREQRRAELLEAALSVIGTVGPTASMDDIAESAGVTKPVLYSHFGDKAGMASALSHALSDRLTADLSTGLLEVLAVPLPPRASAARRRERLRLVVRAALDGFAAFIEREPNLFRFLIHPPGAADPKGEVIALTDHLADMIATVLSDVAPTDVTPSTLALVGRVMVGGGYAVLEWWDRGRNVPRDELVDQLTDFLVAGIIELTT